MNVMKFKYVPSILYRTFYTTTVYNGTDHKVMRKVMGGTKKKKFHYTETPIFNSASSIIKGATDGKKSGNCRRVSVLNKLFMQQITDLMSTGEMSNVFVGYGIEVNRVKVTPDFNLVKIFWLAKGVHNDDEIDKILAQHAGLLRHELSQLKVMGVVPRLQFVKDKQYALIAEVDAKLAVADFGDDHVPSEHMSKLKTEFQLSTALEPHIKAKIEQLENENVNCNEIEEEVPPMPQNILGLNHADILERVKKAIKKSHAPHRTNPNEEETVKIATINEHPIIYSSAKSQREAFHEFLKKRQVLRSKANKDMKNYRPELELVEDEWEQKREEYLGKQEWKTFLDDTDYIDDDNNTDETIK